MQSIIIPLIAKAIHNSANTEQLNTILRTTQETAISLIPPDLKITANALNINSSKYTDTETNNEDEDDDEDDSDFTEHDDTIPTISDLLKETNLKETIRELDD